MAYIGKEPIVGNFQKCDDITVVNGQAAYTLQVSSTNVIPESVNHMLVSLNGILQAPTTSFTVSGATLTFVSNLATGDVIDFVILLGNVLDLGTPSDGTVTNAKLAQDIISGETALTSAPADTDEFLVSDAGTLKRVDASLVGRGKIGQVLQAVKTDTQDTTDDNTWTDIGSLTQAITPVATSSKILVLFSVNAAADIQDHVGIRLMRTSTAIFVGAEGSETNRNCTTATRMGTTEEAYQVELMSGQYLDSPSSTSAITYKIQGNSNDQFFINRSHDNSGADTVQRPVTSSSLTLIEVLA